MSLPFSNPEEIFVYRQPNRKGGFLESFESPFEPPFPSFQYESPQPIKSESLLDRFRKQWEPYEGEAGTWTDPMYWVYLLIAFAILVLVVLGFYWILQSARVAVARKDAKTNRMLAASNQMGMMNTNSNSNLFSAMNRSRVASNDNLLTFSPSTGFVPTKYGSIIYGGNGREICIGCKSIQCERPSHTNSVAPYISSNSLSASCGQG